MADMIRNLELPNGDVYDLPGKAYASTDEWNTPNVEKFEGTTQGKLEATAETFGKIYIVPTPIAGKGGDVVDWEQIGEGSTLIGNIIINGTPRPVYSTGGGGGGGSVVTVTPKATTGMDVATITINGTPKELYADLTITEYNSLVTKLNS